eukprot:c24532_g1_i1.p1 GENE.c24532_g1_i1~~c24532_g1_i1.p1  ORF type:complete len:400 (-),score=136.52 c24532_g1_i1:82-1260(-)
MNNETAAQQSERQNQSQRRLYVGNLDPRVTEQLLFELFSGLGQIEQCKIIQDKQTGGSAGYGFIDFTSRDSAQKALQTMNQRSIYDKEIKVNWAVHSAQTDATYSLYVGDLSKDVDDALLLKTFSTFGECVDGRVMWDPETGRTRGYGFVTFRLRENAEKSLHDMNGAFLGGRAIRVNWANHKQKSQDEMHEESFHSNYSHQPSGSVAHLGGNTGEDNRVIYVGNLAPDVTAQALQTKFQVIGPIEFVRTQTDKGFSFITFTSAADAARAIDTMNGEMLSSRPLKCGWAKFKEKSAAPTGFPMMMPSAFPAITPQPLAALPNPYINPYGASAPVSFIPYPYANPALTQQQMYSAQTGVAALGPASAPGVMGYPPYYTYPQQNLIIQGRPYGQ